MVSPAVVVVIFRPNCGPRARSLTPTPLADRPSAEPFAYFAARESRSSSKGKSRKCNALSHRIAALFRQQLSEQPNIVECYHFLWR